LRFVYERPLPPDPVTGEAPKKPRAYEHQGNLEALWPKVIELQAEGYATYYFLNRAETADHLRFATDRDVTALAVDCDGGLPDEWHMEPSIVVHSSTIIKDGQEVRKGQGLWLIGEGMPVADFKAAQQRLAAHYPGADPSICNPSRILRLPGSVHQKGEPQAVTFEDRTNGLLNVVGAPSAQAVLAGLPEGGQQRKASQASGAGQGATNLDDLRRRPVSLEEVRLTLMGINPCTGRHNPATGEGWFPIVRGLSETPIIGNDDPKTAAANHIAIRELGYMWFCAHVYYRALDAAELEHLRGEHRNRAEFNHAFDSAPSDGKSYNFGTLVNRRNAERCPPPPPKMRVETLPSPDPVAAPYGWSNWRDPYTGGTLPLGSDGKPRYPKVPAGMSNAAAWGLAEKNGYYLADEAHPWSADDKEHVPSEDDARIMARFMGTDASSAPLVKSNTLRDYLYSPVAAPPRRDLVSEWIAADRFIPIVGPGGNHKSRVIQQLSFCKLYDRELFKQPASAEAIKGLVRLGTRPCGGIPVGRIEMLSYEDPEDAAHRSIEAMKGGFQIPPEPGEDDPSERFTRHEVQMPVLTVDDNGKITLTPLGLHMLRRWEDLAKAGEHMILWFDSFFDAVVTSSKARIDDGHARRLIRLLDHWCKILNCTILAPFHPSRSGVEHGHTGYAPAFENAPRQVLRIGAKTEPVKDGVLKERRRTGEFVLEVHKWNDGTQGKRITFRFERGQLVSTDDMEDVAADTMQAAVDVVLSFTYGAALEKFGPGMSTAEHDDLERSCRNRIRRTGRGNQWLAGDHPAELTVDHPVMQKFREAAGNPKASVRDFISASERAVGALRLGYREADKSAASRNRLPAGFHIVACKPDHAVDFEGC
jgi:hypothetical protein